MTNREKEIYNLILKNPMISQKEIAEKLGIQRSSVGVQISNLIKKGKLKGKGYIVNEEDYIVVIGGSNIDLQGTSLEKLVYEDSNPGYVTMSLGGVARNIAENMARLGLNIKLISVVGDDLYGKKIIEESKLTGINMDEVIISKNSPTSTYLSILDNSGDMKLAINASDIISNVDIDYIKSNNTLIKNARCIVLDTNLDENVLDFIFDEFSNKDIFVDTVSSIKALKLIKNLKYINTLKPNKIEAEILTGIKITDEVSLNKAVDSLHEKGVKNVYLSMGKDGVIFSNSVERKKYSNYESKLVSATGAGDAFMAGIVYSYIKHSFNSSTLYGLAMASMAINTKETINRDITSEK